MGNELSQKISDIDRCGTARTWWSTGSASTSSTSAIGSIGWGLLLGMLLAVGQVPETRPPLQPKSKRGNSFRSGPGATRTRDLLLRRQALYPAELRTRKDLDPAEHQIVPEIVPIPACEPPILTTHPPDGTPAPWVSRDELTFPLLEPVLWPEFGPLPGAGPFPALVVFVRELRRGGALRPDR
jgi:hypothetical protein